MTTTSLIVAVPIFLLCLLRWPTPAHALRWVNVVAQARTRSRAFHLQILHASANGDAPPEKVPRRATTTAAASSSTGGGAYDTWTVPQLKAALKDRKLTVTGVKAVLLQRLLDNDAVTGGSGSSSSGVSDAAETPPQNQPPSLEELLDEVPAAKKAAAPKAPRTPRAAAPAAAAADAAPAAHEGSGAGASPAGAPSLRRGDAVQVTVLRYGPLGASVLHAASGKTGLILKVCLLCVDSEVGGANPRTLYSPLSSIHPSNRTKSSTGRR
jgi:hypothetical protein